MHDGNAIHRSSSAPAADVAPAEAVSVLQTSSSEPALVEFVRSIGLKDDVAALLTSNEITKEMLMTVMEKVVFFLVFFG
jgi:hypothetical protein